MDKPACTWIKAAADKSRKSSPAYKQKQNRHYRTNFITS
jgi:hypothetical protein